MSVSLKTAICSTLIIGSLALADGASAQTYGEATDAYNPPALEWELGGNGLEVVIKSADEERIQESNVPTSYSVQEHAEPENE